MAIAVFLQPQVDMIVHDYLRELKVLPLVEAGPRSQYLKDKSLNMGPPDSTATQLTFQNMTTGGTVILTSSMVATWPSTLENPDLTSGYHAATTTSNVFNIGRFYSDQFSIADAELWANAAGRGVIDNQLKLTVQVLMQSLEEDFLSNAYQSGTFYSGSSVSVGADFTLTTTSDSAIQQGFANLAYGADIQNWPVNDRYLAVNPIVAANILQYSTKVGNRLYESPHDGGRSPSTENSVMAGQLHEFMGFKIISTPSQKTSTQAVAFTTTATGLVMPRGMMIEELRYIGSWAEYVRLRMLAGIGVLGPLTSAPLGNSGPQGNQGALRITCVNQ